MWSTSKRDRCIRLIVLILNFAACMAVVYIYMKHANKQEALNGISPENVFLPEKLTDEQCIQVCESRACIWHANTFLRYVNENVDPCDDFRSFLCSGFITEFGPNENANSLSETRKLMITKLKGILDNIEAEPESASAKMKIVYDSCIDYGSSELQGIKDLKNLLYDIGILNWPNLPEDFSFNVDPLPKILGYLNILGQGNFINIRHRSGNETHESSVLVTFYPFRFNQTTYLTRELAVSILKYFDLDPKDMDMVIEDHELVNNNILKLYEEYEICRKEHCPEVEIDCARQDDDYWHEFCETLRHFLNLNDTNNITPVAIERPEDTFFKEMFSVFQSFPKRTLANFAALSLIKTLQAELNFYFRLSKLKQKDFEHGSLIGAYELDRRKFCARWIADHMKIPLENEFFHLYLTKSVAQEITNIYKDFSSKITDLISLQEWVHLEPKSNLIRQIQNVTLNVESLSRLFPNDSYVNKAYEKFLPVRKSFIENVIRIKKLKPIIQLPFDAIPTEELVSQITEFDVQASAGIPFIELHFGMLFPPFYVPGHTNLMNQALLAPIVSHEFGHFIDGAFAFEANDLNSYEEKRECLRNQFSRFKFEYLNENLNGSRYDTENMPDSVATTLIDKIIEQYSSSQDIILPGLSYSTKQLLYMSSIQMWCAKGNLEKDIHYKNVDTHAPPEFRLLGIMQNSRGFPATFHCPEGSFMNPETKCALLDTNSI